MKAVALVLGFLLFTPVILWIVVSEWFKYLLHGPAPSPFIPEAPLQPFPKWAADMERARQLQAHEEAR